MVRAGIALVIVRVEHFQLTYRAQIAQELAKISHITAPTAAARPSMPSPPCHAIGSASASPRRLRASCSTSSPQPLEKSRGKELAG